MPEVLPAFVINTKLSGNQTRNNSAVLTDGRIVVVWADENDDLTVRTDIRGRIFNADGTPAGDDFKISVEPASTGHNFFKHLQVEPSVAALTTGGFAVTYMDARDVTAGNTAYRTVVQRYNADGSKDGADVAITPLMEMGVFIGVGAPDVVGTANGGYAVGYQIDDSPSSPNYPDSGIVLQSFSFSGAVSNLVAAVNSTDQNIQEHVELTTLADGSVVAVWFSRTSTSPSLDVGFYAGRTGELKGQRFDASGVPIGGEISFLREGPVAGASNTGNGSFHDVTGLAGGGFVVTWTDTQPNESGGRRVLFQLVDNNGALVGGIQTVTNVQVASRPQVAGGPDGGFLLTWDNSGIAARHYNADGSARGNSFSVYPIDSNQAKVEALPDGNYFVSWINRIPGGEPSDDVRGSVVLVETTITGTTNSDVLAGSRGPNIINALDSDDVLFGLGGNDTLNAGAGNDILYGDAGDDSMVGGTGNDQYVVNQRSDVVVELADEGNDIIYIGYDTYNLGTYIMSPNIEVARLFGEAQYVFGSEGGEQIVANPLMASQLLGYTGDDVLWGGSLAHTLEGGEGDDIIRGQDGPVRMVGGTGNDSFVVGNLAAVIVELDGEGADTVYVAVQDYVMPTEVEVAYLSGGATRLTGSATSEQLVANPGAASRLAGEGGDDTLWGSLLADTMLGGAGNDIMRGQGGDDQMTGGTGNDQYVVFTAASTITELADGGFDIAYVAGAGAFFIGENVEQGLLLGAGNHVIGNALSNLLAGNSSGIASTIDAGGGADLIFGTAAADTITGGAGDDTIYAGGGADRLVYAAPGWGTDVIAGFVPGEGGRLQFLSSSGVTSFDQFAVANANGNTQIGHANGAVLLFGVASLTQSDFIFG